MRVDRIKEAMDKLGWDQSRLAREVDCTQGAIWQILDGRVRRSRLLPDIADALGVSLDYLKGRTDDPAQSAAPRTKAETAPKTILLGVALPSERLLQGMFQGLLEVVGVTDDVDVRAATLARLLPGALEQAATRSADSRRHRTPGQRQTAARSHS